MKLRVRFAETDQMGIAHHSAYVVWLEAARVEWLRERGLSYRDMENQGISLAVSAIQIDYRASAHFDDELDIETRQTEARSRRFKFSYELTRPADNALVAKAETVHTPIDAQGKAMRMPGTWLDKLKLHLQKDVG